MTPLTEKKVKALNNSAICENLLRCHFSPSFYNFNVLAHKKKRHLLKTKESVLIMREKLNRNINSATLYLFDKVS